MGRIKTFYDELGVGRDATGPEIKRAFKEVAKIYHPDKNPPEKQAWAHEQMSRFNFIFDTLTNSKTRKEYDGLVEKYESMPRKPRCGVRTASGMRLSRNTRPLPSRS